MNAWFSDDITFCPDSSCTMTACYRNQANIRDRTIQHSYFVEVPDDCPKKQIKKAIRHEAKRMLQVDMEMPKNCLDCPACNEYAICAIPVEGKGFYEQDVSEYSDGRPDWCPLHDPHDTCVNCPLQPIRPTYRDNKVYCGKCGKRIPLKIKADFCHKCGKAIWWAP